MLLRVFQWPVASKKGSLHTVLTITDIQSIYPGNGISDTVLELFARHMLSPSSNVAVLSPLTYEAIKRYRGDKDTVVKAFNNVNGKNFKMKKSTIVFMCKARYHC